MTKPARAPGRETVAARFRREIEAAEAEGATRQDLVVRLTLNDSIRLRRDADVAVSDISYADGVMRFLGVLVEAGGVPESRLQQGPDEA